MAGEEARYQYVDEEGRPTKGPAGSGLVLGEGPFVSSIMQLRQDTYFKAVVLSVWDNVVGPRVKQVWLGRDRLDGRFYQRLLPFIAKCTLAGEISREIRPEAAAEMKFYALAELGCVMVSFVFGAPVGSAAAAPDIFSLSLVLPLHQMRTYLELHTLCADRMGALIRKLQVMLRTEGSVTGILVPFTAALKPFLTSIADIRVSSLSHHIDMAKTVFGDGGGDGWDVGFLRAALTSHLQTGGVTIVVGRDAERTQQLINTLAIFLSRGERRRSRPVRAGVDSYAPDLVLQGMITQEGEAFDPGVLMQSAHASTVIDVDKKTVLQTQRENVYHVIQKAHEEDELQAMAAADEEGPARGGGSASLLHPVRSGAALVKDLLAQLFRSPRTVLSTALVGQFKRLITRRALVMFEYIDALGASPDNPLDAEQLARLRKELDIPSMHDLHLLMAAAEKHRKGMFITVLGDPAERQARLVDLLANF